MRTFLLTLLLAWPASAGSLLVLELEHEPAYAEASRILNDVIATAAEDNSTLEVVTGKDLKRMVELEGEKQAIGCESVDGACLAEIAGAMGAELVIFGQLGKLGDAYVVTINLYEAASAKSRGRRTIEARDEAALPSRVREAVRALVSDEAPSSVSPLLLPAGLIVGGVVLAGAGYGIALSQNGVLESSSADASAKDSAYVIGHGALWTGIVIGGAAIALGGWSLWAASDD